MATIPEYEQLKQAVAGLDADITKAVEGNKAAGTRVRNKMQEVKDLAQAIRKKILELRDDSAKPAAKGGNGTREDGQAVAAAPAAAKTDPRD
jgi:SMC interacting uncharacterized protein involved in chromosome segregation